MIKKSAKRKEVAKFLERLGLFIGSSGRTERINAPKIGKRTIRDSHGNEFGDASDIDWMASIAFKS